MPLDFTAIDFETANRSSASACAVGLVRVRDGRVTAQDAWLIRPPAGIDEFEPRNIEIHGILPEHVADAPGWAEQMDRIAAFAGNDVLVAHNAGFDMAVMRRASDATGADCRRYESLCSVMVARRIYDLPTYRLPSAAAAAGFTDFQHHDALADALACAHIIIDAASRTDSDDIRALADAVDVAITRMPAPALASA